jgi:hypothetical protein
LEVDFGTVVESFEINLRLPFTPPLVTVSGPSSSSDIVVETKLQIKLNYSSYVKKNYIVAMFEV